MKTNPQCSGPYYQDKLWVDNYKRHVQSLNTIGNKSPPKPIKLNTSHSMANLQDDQWYNLSNSRLYNKYLKMSKAQKQNVVLNMSDLQIGQRLSKNLQKVRKRKQQGIKSQNISLLRRLQERITSKNQFTILFKSSDKSLNQKNNPKSSRIKKKIKLPKIKYPCKQS